MADGTALCAECRKGIDEAARERACGRCGHGLGPYASCPVCAKGAPPFQATVRVGVYHGPLGSLVKRVKYRGVRYPVPLLAELLLGRLRESGAAEKIDVATAVPLHWWRYYRRGFNQAAVLGRELRRRGLEAPLERLLSRVRDTPPQVGLSRTERQENVRGAFRVVRPGAVEGRRVLLLDDVMTTGATAGACARELLGAGAREVTVGVAVVPGEAVDSG